ncbi:hypothetical protein T10_11546 [Trichinella papuae]|uniref:Uncharacterized protein n=1 Tax=Trichinella papuae TaxID=268474 RepID=A0A0V1LZJ3_9BILA|nr:hypothetical protein T10_11546 [Trichinella papuae]
MRKRVLTKSFLNFQIVLIGNSTFPLFVLYRGIG